MKRKLLVALMAMAMTASMAACGGGETVRITELQAPGKKRMMAADYLLGHPIQVS